jgi:hypothetical protein
MPNLLTANAIKKPSISDGYLSSSAEEPAHGHIGAFDAFWLDLLYGPRFRSVTGNMSVIHPPSPLWHVRFLGLLPSKKFVLSKSWSGVITGTSGISIVMSLGSAQWVNGML